MTKSCPTLCDPMDCSMPGFFVLHHLLELCKIVSLESVMLSDHLILCRPLLLLPSIFPSIRVFCFCFCFFPSELALHIKWPKYWSFSFSISPPNEYSELISFRKFPGWISLQSKEHSRVFFGTTIQEHQLCSIQLSLWPNSDIHT